ncbi:hypothetical protein [Candidatus Enterococcus murrayae]|nr:hypothetical protein [Enterococcus sp. MJM16]
MMKDQDELSETAFSELVIRSCVSKRLRSDVWQQIKAEYSQ